MISKELLSEVLGEDVLSVKASYSPFGKNYAYIEYRNIDNKYSTVFSIYELAHKCKEWAVVNGYTLSILYDSDLLRCKPLRLSVSIRTRDGVCKFRIKDVPEHEAIFKACEWILKQKENK